jgi:hypothetical protein
MRPWSVLGVVAFAAGCSPVEPAAWLVPSEEAAPASAEAARTRGLRVTRPVFADLGTPAALRRRGPWTLDLGEVQVDVTLTGIARIGKADVVRGHVEGYPDHEVIVATRGDFVAGVVRTSDVTYRLRPWAAARVALDEVAADRPELEPVVPLDLPGTPGLGTTGDGSAPIVDLLVAASAPVVEAYGGEAGLEAEAAALVSQLNDGWAASGIPARARLAGVYASDWDEGSFTFRGALEAVADPDDLVLDEVAAARDTVGADAVTLLVQGDDTACGLAYLMAPARAAFAKSAYGVVDEGCAAGSLSFVHELGHTFGSQHDRENAGSEPAYPYGYGWRDADAGFRTVMAYTCDGAPCPRRNLWSNPEVSVNGAPAGADVDTPEAASNVASITLTAPVVAAFRDPVEVEPTPEAAEILLPTEGERLTSDRLTLVWEDAGADAYEIAVGSSEGASDLALVDAGTAASATISGLPTDGKALYVTLYSQFGETWLTDSAVYTAKAPASVAARLTSPSSGSVLSASSVTFAWTDAGAPSYALVVGSTPYGTEHGAYMTKGTSLRLSGLPDDGRTLYVTLYTMVGTSWLVETATYTAYDADPDEVEPARLLSPTPGSTLTGRAFTFAWTDPQAQAYSLVIGDGVEDWHAEMLTTTTARVVLPDEAEPGPMDVILATKLDGFWYARRYTFTLAE